MSLLTKLENRFYHFKKKITKNHISFLQIVGGVILFFTLLSITIAWFQKEPTVHDRVFKIGQDAKGGGFDFGESERQGEAFLQELLFKVVKMAGLHVDLHFLSKDQLKIQFDNGTLDGILLFGGPKTWIQKNLLYSNNLYFLGPVLVIRENFDIAHPKETEKMEIGVKSGFPFFAHTGASFVRLKVYDDMQVALDDLLKEKTDGVILDIFSAKLYLQGLYKNKLKIAFPLLTNQGMYLAFKENKDNKEFVELFDKELESLKKEGGHDALIEKWSLPNTEIYHPSI